jgi:hypothetical protein
VSRSRLPRLGLALLAGVVSTAALALSAPPSAGWKADPDEQFLLEVAIRQMRLGDGARAYATPDGVCVILADVVAALDLPVTVDQAAGTASGWVFAEANRFLIDRRAGSTTIRGIDGALPPHAIRDAPEGWCVDTAALSHWLDIEVKANTAGSLLMLRSEAKLPLELARERRDRAAGLLRKASFDLGKLPKVALPYRMWRPPVADFMLSAGLLRDKRTGTRFDRGAAVLGAGEFGGFSWESRAGSDDRGRPNLLRLRAYRSDPDGGLLGPLEATSAAAGDVDGFVSPLSGGSVSGRGATVTNRPLHLLASFDRTSFAGELPAGWDAELYRNGQLVAFAAGGSDGRYRFDDVALLYGDNQFEIVSYGPQGQVRRRRELASVGQEFVPPGKTWYWAGIVDPERDLFGLNGRSALPDASGPRGTLALEHGFDQRTSGGLLVQSLMLGGRRVTWTEATLRRSLGAALLEFGAARNGDGGRAFRAQALARLGPVNLSGQSLFADEFSVAGTGLLAKADHRLTADVPVKLGRTLLPVQADLRYRRLEGGSSQLEANTRTFFQLSRFNLALGAKLLRTDSGGGKRAPDQITVGAIGSGKVRGVRMRGVLDWRLGWRSGLQRAEVAAYWNGGDRADWEGGLGWDGDYRRARSRVGYVRRFAGLAGNLSVEAASDGSLAAGLGLSFSLGSGGGRPRFSREPLAIAGNIEANVYRDLDGNGRRDPGEPAEPDAVITAGLQLAERPTDAGGRATLAGLQTYRPVAVGVDTSSLKDPSLAPAKAAQVVVPRAGVVAHVDIPLVGAGSLEGMLLKDGGSGFEGLDLELIDEDGHVVATTRSDYDGFFLFERVTYGRYRLRLTEASAKVAGVAAALEGGIIVSDGTPGVRLGPKRLSRSSDRIASADPAP